MTQKNVRQFTSVDVQALSSFNSLNFTEKELNQADIFQWIIENKIQPYQLKQLLEKQNIEIKSPLWTFSGRMGQLLTELPDGMKVYIAGEYEDFYDPDFKIYNDIVIEKPNGEIELWNYPKAQFPPTDFYAAHYDEQTHSIFLIGNLGYPETRKEGITQVLKVKLKSMDIERLECFGQVPSWLNHHEMSVINDDELIFYNGYVIKEKKYLRNLYTWKLNLRTLEWTFPEQILFDHWTLKSKNYYGFPLFECSQLLWDEKHWKDEKFEQTKVEIIERYGMLPDYKTYSQLFYPFEDTQISHDECEYRKHICSSQGYTFYCFEDDDLIEVIFPNTIPVYFQQIVINDLKSKLKQISGHDVVAEKVM